MFLPAGFLNTPLLYAYLLLPPDPNATAAALSQALAQAQSSGNSAALASALSQAVSQGGSSAAQAVAQAYAQVGGGPTEVPHCRPSNRLRSLLHS